MTTNTPSAAPVDAAILETRGLLTRIEAAERLRVSVATVDRLAARRELPPIRVGRAVRFAPSDVARVAERAKRRPLIVRRAEALA